MKKGMVVDEFGVLPSNWDTERY